MAREIDSIDRKILDELQKDGRLSIVELANRVHLTKTPCAERVRRLEKSGVLQGYHARLNPTKVGKDHVTVVHVNLSRTNGGTLTEFNHAVQGIKEIQSCMMIAGSFDYMLTVRTRDMAHFRQVLDEKIGALPGLMQTHSFAVMEVVKDQFSIRMTET